MCNIRSICVKKIETRTTRRKLAEKKINNNKLDIDMWSPESEINSIAMVTTMRHSQSSSSGEFTKKKEQVEVQQQNRSQSKCKAQTAKEKWKTKNEKKNNNKNCHADALFILFAFLMPAAQTGRMRNIALKCFRFRLVARSFAASTPIDFLPWTLTRTISEK